MLSREWLHRARQELSLNLGDGRAPAFAVGDQSPEPNTPDGGGWPEALAFWDCARDRHAPRARGYCLHPCDDGAPAAGGRNSRGACRRFSELRHLRLAASRAPRRSRNSSKLRQRSVMVLLKLSERCFPSLRAGHRAPVSLRENKSEFTRKSARDTN